MDKQGGPTQAPLSLLGTTSRLGGGTPPMQSYGATIQGPTPVPQNQFGQDVEQNGNQLSNNSNMGALLGNPIGGPER